LEKESGRATARRSGIIHPGPNGRARRDKEVEWQQECRTRKKITAALQKRVIEEEIGER